MGERITFDMARLEERVRAAARRIDHKNGTEWRRLESRSRAQFDPRSGWMIPLEHGTTDIYAVELVPSADGAPGSVMLRRNADDAEIRTSAEAIYEMWVEELPAGSIP